MRFSAPSRPQSRTPMRRRRRMKPLDAEQERFATGGDLCKLGRPGGSTTAIDSLLDLPPACAGVDSTYGVSLHVPRLTLAMASRRVAISMYSPCAQRLAKER